MLHWVDLSTLYLIDALTCLAPIWATFRLASMPVTRQAEGSPGWGVAAVLDGFRYLAGNTVVLMSFVVDLIAMILGMPRALFPQMAHQRQGLLVVLAVAVWGLAMIVFGLLSGIAHGRAGPLLWAALAF